MNRARRHLFIGATLAIAFASPAFAQSTYPNKPIRLVVPFTTGGVTDTSARVVADALSKRLGQQVIVDNRPGASGNIGTQQVATADADGYTLLLGFDGTMVINPHVFDKVPFNTVKDFAPVGKIGDAILILVAYPGLPAKNLRDVLALSKNAVGRTVLRYLRHWRHTAHSRRTAEATHRRQSEHVPYKGGGQAIIDAMGGNIPLVYTAVAGAQQHVKSGKLIGVAVSSAQRSASLPTCPHSSKAALLISKSIRGSASWRLLRHPSRSSTS
jgi:tripartite-type tricarboxylate transporter receptor subunit TctC